LRFSVTVVRSHSFAQPFESKDKIQVLFRLGKHIVDGPSKFGQFQDGQDLLGALN
jgi:hypothetical protein